MNKHHHGFTLIEVSIVLIVLGYILKQFVLPFGARHQQTMREQTLAQLESVSQALDGFAMTRHRLPCPASEQSSGMALDTCSQVAVGFVPAGTLGVSGPVDHKGRLLDSWGNPLLYAVSSSDHDTEGIVGQPDFTTAGEMARVGLSNLRSDVVVCHDVRNGRCARDAVRANQVPYVVLSLGKDTSSSGQQAFNQDNDLLFVVQAYAQATVGNTGFDDIVLWASESQLIYNLVKAGSLP